MCKSLRKSNCCFECITSSIKIIWGFLYYYRYRISILFAVCLHIFDLITDMIVTNDLYEEKSPYFLTSIGILIFSFAGSAILSLDDILFHEFTVLERLSMYHESIFTMKFILSTIAYIYKGILWMILDIVQCNYLISSLLAFWYNEYDDDSNLKKNLLNKRLIESLLESGPQALFQLFIILNQSSSKTFINLVSYYISVKISLLSLTYTLISMDHYYLTEFINSTGNEIINKPPSYFSKYSLISILFRLTEVFSRVGLLACISQIYDGYYLFLFILIDYLCINILNVLKRYLRYKYENCQFPSFAFEIIKELETDYFNRIKDFSYRKDAVSDSIKDYRANKIILCWKIYKKDSVKNIFKLKEILKGWKLEYIKQIKLLKSQIKEIKGMKKKIFNNTKKYEILGFKHIINNIKFLGVYYDSLSSKIVKKKSLIKLKNFYNYNSLNINLPSNKKWWNKISVHFISKYFNHLIISIILIYKLLINTYSNTIILISISSMSCFILNMISLYFLTKWNNSDEKLLEKLIMEPIINLKCTCLQICFSCYKKKTKEIRERENMSKNDINLLDC